MQRDQGLDFKIVRNWSRDELEGAGEPVGRSIVRQVLSSGEPVLIKDAVTDQRYDQSESILRMQIRSVMAAPLEVDGVTAATISTSAPSPATPLAISSATEPPFSPAMSLVLDGSWPSTARALCDARFH